MYPIYLDYLQGGSTYQLARGTDNVMYASRNGEVYALSLSSGQKTTDTYPSITIGDPSDPSDMSDWYSKPC